MAKVTTNQERLNQLFDLDPQNDTMIGASLGVSKQTISAWRNGTRSPKRSMLQVIAEKYGVTIEWLLGWDLPAHEPMPYTVEEREIIDAYRSTDKVTQNHVRLLLGLK